MVKILNYAYQDSVGKEEREKKDMLEACSALPDITAFIFINIYLFILVAQSVKNLPAMQETEVQSLGWEDPLEKGMAIHSSILPWRSPWTEEPDGLQSMRLQSQTQLSK